MNNKDLMKLYPNRICFVAYDSDTEEIVCWVNFPKEYLNTRKDLVIEKALQKFNKEVEEKL